MDHTRIGLDYIVENREYVIKLGTALDTNNVTVKKQVFELLSALCAYNADGYTRALETLDHFQVENSPNKLSRFNEHFHTLLTFSVIEIEF